MAGKDTHAPAASHSAAARQHDRSGPVLSLMLLGLLAVGILTASEARAVVHDQLPAVSASLHVALPWGLQLPLATAVAQASVPAHTLQGVDAAQVAASQPSGE